MKNTVITSVAFLCISLPSAFSDTPWCTGKIVDCHAKSFGPKLVWANGSWIYAACYADNAPDEVLVGGPKKDNRAIESTSWCAMEWAGSDLENMEITVKECSGAARTPLVGVACKVDDDGE